MVTLSIIKPLQVKTPTGNIERLPGEQLHVNNVVFAVSLHAAGTARINSDVDMVELMQELIRVDHETNSDMYLDDRIQGSAAVLVAYQTGNKILFIEQVIRLIGLYVKCRQV